MKSSDLSRPHVYKAGNQRILLLLHGTGGDEFDLLRLGAALDPEASILSPRGMFLEAGMNRFFERYPDGTFNEQSILEAVQELALFIEAASAEYGFDTAKITAAGFSNGANTAAALLLLRPDLVANAALFGSTRPFAQITHTPDLEGKRVWIANGDLDGYAPVAVTEEWVSRLGAFGAEVSWLRHPGGHQISPAHVQEISKQLN